MSFDFRDSWNLRDTGNISTNYFDRSKGIDTFNKFGGNEDFWKKSITGPDPFKLSSQGSTYKPRMSDSDKYGPLLSTVANLFNKARERKESGPQGAFGGGAQQFGDYTYLTPAIIPGSQGDSGKSGFFGSLGGAAGALGMAAGVFGPLGIPIGAAVGSAIDAARD